MGLFDRLNKPDIEKLERNNDKEGLIKALSYQSDSEVRRKATFALGRIGDKRAVDQLIIALKDSDIDVRFGAANALGIIKDPKSIDPLISALKDSESWLVREQAAEALGKIKDPRAVNPLIVALKDSKSSARDDVESHIRRNVVTALGKIGDSRAVGPLISALKDLDFKVQEDAAEALSKISVSDVKPLIEALKDSDFNVRYKAAEMLDKIKWTPNNDEIAAYYWMSKNKIDNCVALGTPAVEPLVATLKDCKFWCRDAAIALGQLGDTRAVEPLIIALKNPGIYVREEAAKALGKLGDRRAVQPLIDALEDPDSDVRNAAAFSLGKIGDAKAIDPLIAAMKNREWGERDHLVDALDILDWKPDLGANGTWYWISKQNVEKCVCIGTSAVDPLIAALNDKHWKICMTAAEALGKLGDTRAVEPLISSLKYSEYWSVRAKVAISLGEIGDVRAIDPLVAAINDHYFEVATAAREALLLFP